MQIYHFYEINIYTTEKSVNKNVYAIKKMYMYKHIHIQKCIYALLFFCFIISVTPYIKCNLIFECCHLTVSVKYGGG